MLSTDTINVAHTNAYLALNLVNNLDSTFPIAQLPVYINERIICNNIRLQSLLTHVGVYIDG